MKVLDIIVKVLCTIVIIPLALCGAVITGVLCTIGLIVYLPVAGCEDVWRDRDE